jgi:Uma2 family endonuclease
MITASISGTQQILFRDVDWRDYGYFLRMFADRPGVRLTYDRGRLEIMPVSFEHEGFAEFIGYLILTLAQVLKLDFEPGGTTTLRLRRKLRGLEPDKCYWIKDVPRVRGKARISLPKDPPPDLAVEIDITSSSLDRMAIYATLKIPEIWRFDGRTLSFHVLNSGGVYQTVPSSRLFPFVKPADLLRILRRRKAVGSVEALEEFRHWVRQNVAGNGRR